MSKKHDKKAAGDKGTWLTYRPEIKVLDCTIRDGGLMNDHKFDDDTVRAVYRACVEGGIDYMEIGYKNSKKQFSPEKFGPWKHCDEEDLRRGSRPLPGLTAHLLVELPEGVDHLGRSERRGLNQPLAQRFGAGLSEARPAVAIEHRDSTDAVPNELDGLVLALFGQPRRLRVAHGACRIAPLLDHRPQHLGAIALVRLVVAERPRRHATDLVCALVRADKLDPGDDFIPSPSHISSI